MVGEWVHRLSDHARVNNAIIVFVRLFTVAHGVTSYLEIKTEFENLVTRISLPCLVHCRHHERQILPSYNSHKL